MKSIITLTMMITIIGATNANIVPCSTESQQLQQEIKHSIYNSNSSELYINYEVVGVNIVYSNDTSYHNLSYMYM